MKRSIAVREATEADADSALALRAAVFAETEFMLWEPAEFKDTAADEAARIKRISAAPNSVFLLATEGNALLGFCAAMGGHVNRLRHSASLALGVLRSHWGEGVGFALLEGVEDWSKSAGVVRLELTVHTSNVRAVNLYLRRGFQVEGLRRSSLLVNGRYVDEYLMSKLRADEA